MHEDACQENAQNQNTRRKILGNGESVTLEVTIWRRVGLDLVQEMLGLCEAKNGTKID